jgi:hypothetical protein
VLRAPSGPFFLEFSMTLSNALELVRSGGKAKLEHKSLELTQTKGILYLWIGDRREIVSEKAVRDLYWRDSWVAA